MMDFFTFLYFKYDFPYLFIFSDKVSEGDTSVQLF